MADLTVGLAVAHRLDARYERRSRDVSDVRKTREADDARLAENEKSAEQAYRSNEARKVDEQRSEDRLQRLHDQQLAAETRNADEDHQRGVADARQAREALPRGSIIDIVA